MATSKRLQVGAGIGAVLLLGGAWLLTVHGEEPSTDEAPDPAPATSTTVTTAPPDPTTTTTTEAQRERNTEWGELNLTDVTAEAGLDEPHSSDAPIGADGQAGGVAVGDIDGDGDLDVVLTRIGLPNRLLRNDGDGTFTDIAEAAGADGPDPDQGYAAAVFVDVDGDGDLDLFLTGAGRNAAVLLINDGTGTFTEGTDAAGLGGLAGAGLAGTASFGAAFDDWDGDGDLDLIVLQWYKAPFEFQLQSLPPPDGTDPAAYEPCALAARRAADPVPSGLPGSGSRLFTNDGTGRFTDVTADAELDLDRVVGFQPVFADVDGDGWRDLLITGDYCTSRLYRNLAGEGWEDITEAAGVGTDQNGMGSVVADLDGDGILDWFVSAIAAANPDGCRPEDPCSRAGNRLYLGNGDGTFRDETDRFGVRDGSWGWGAVAADLNHDGRLDLALANGVRFRAPGDDPTLRAGDDSDDDPTRVWVNTGGGPWPEVADRIGVTDRANGKGIVAFDMDGDGDLDLLIANTEAPPVLYRNDTPPGPATRWLQLRLRDPGSPNPFAIGARVSIYDEPTSTPRILDVRAGGSFQSGDPTDLHVGLGTLTQVARVEILWPGSADPQVLRDLDVDRLIRVDRE